MVVLNTTTSNHRLNEWSHDMPLHNLPYDLLLNVAQYLDLREIHALQLVSLSILFTRTSIGCLGGIRRERGAPGL